MNRFSKYVIRGMLGLVVLAFMAEPLFWIVVRIGVVVVTMFVVGLPARPKFRR